MITSLTGGKALPAAVVEQIIDIVEMLAGDPVAPRDFTNAATDQEYFPEWFLSASTLSDISAFARTYNQDQWQHAFGISPVVPVGNGGNTESRCDAAATCPGGRRHPFG